MQSISPGSLEGCTAELQPGRSRLSVTGKFAHTPSHVPDALQRETLPRRAGTHADMTTLSDMGPTSAAHR
jgi:hypothetical protein